MRGDTNTMPSEHEKETAFLRRCIRYDESPAGRQLDERIAQVQRDERCLRRASWGMALVALLAAAGLVYGAVLLNDFPTHMSLFASQFVIKIISALVIGSLICLLGFAVLGLIYRKELNLRREECRRRVTRVLESRLGDSAAPSRNGEIQTQDAALFWNRLKKPMPDGLNRPGPL